MIIYIYIYKYNTLYGVPSSLTDQLTYLKDPKGPMEGVPIVMSACKRIIKNLIRIRVSHIS